MKKTLTRKQETGIALAMGQQRNHNPARSMRGKGVKGQGTRTQPEGWRGFFGRIYW